MDVLQMKLLERQLQIDIHGSAKAIMNKRVV
jgi:hypothetical protein